MGIFSKNRIFLCVGVFFLTMGITSADELVTPAAVPEEKAEITQLALGLGATNTVSNGQSFKGLGASAALFFPLDTPKNASFGISFRRVFDGENVKRHDILTHLNYAFTEVFRVGVMGGLEYVSADESSNSYLKPLIGLETAVRLFSWSRFKSTRSGISLIADIRHAAGATGSLLLNSGDKKLNAAIFSIGLSYSFAIFGES